MLLPNTIEMNPDIMMGKPCIRGTRIPVYVILQKIAEGETSEQVLKDYPQLRGEHIAACLKYAAMLASEEVLLPAAMKLFLDENLSPALVPALRASGHDATSAYDAGLSGTSDSRIREFCIQENRVLVTLDSDFGNILRFPPNATPGVMWLRPSFFSDSAVTALLTGALLQLADNDLNGCLVVIDESTIRIRPGILSS